MGNKKNLSFKQIMTNYGVIIIMVCLIVFTGITRPNFLTANNLTNILATMSFRLVIALGIAGCIITAGCDLSAGRMIGFGGCIAGTLLQKMDYSNKFFPNMKPLNIWLALIVVMLICAVFGLVTGFFIAYLNVPPFISTMANMLVIFGLVTYSTKGVSFGGIEQSIPGKIIPKVGGFPIIILWAIAAVAIVWFIWNKTKFGKNLYAVGGNPEAASVSGISVFKVTLGAFIMAGILYGFGSWLECIRMIGSGSAAYGQGWEMDADRKSTRLNSSHVRTSRMPSSA